VQEDLQLVVPVLDTFSNMNLEPELFDQVNNLKRLMKVLLLVFFSRDLNSLDVTLEEGC